MKKLKNTELPRLSRSIASLVADGLWSLYESQDGAEYVLVIPLQGQEPLFFVLSPDGEHIGGPEIHAEYRISDLEPILLEIEDDDRPRIKVP